MAEENNVTYVFGEFSLDPSLRSFSKNGEALHLPAKEFDTLEYLLKNRGRVLTKGELMAAIWDDTFVEEGNLAQYISRLRKILDTNGTSHIQTLPKKGYRFDADVDVIRKAPKRSRRISSTAVAFAAMALTALLVGSIWLFFARAKPEAVVRQTADKPIALTDGKQDDGVAEWTSDNHIRFFRRVSPRRIESWIMDLDGSNQHREIPPIKDFVRGFWSPDGKKIFFMKDGDEQTTYLANADGTGETTLPMLVGNSDWSPDSKRFVYETKVSEGNTEIFLYTIATHENLNLSRNNVFDADPSFAPDGQHVVFVSTRDGNPEIYMVDLAGDDLRRLTDHPAFDHFPTISPDGTQLLFSSNRGGDDSQFYMRNLNDDAAPVKISNMSGIEGAHEKAWSPDGTKLAFSAEVAGRNEVFLMHVDPFAAQKVAADPGLGLQGPKVSPDGAKLLIEARMDDRSTELRVMELASGSVRSIYRAAPDEPPAFLLSAQWSPDSATVVFSDRVNGNTDIYSVNAIGGGLRRLTDDTLPDIQPTYSTDGSHIYFVRDFYGRPKIYRMDADGSDVKPFSEKEGYELSPAASPDGLLLIYSADREDGRKMGLDVYAAPLNAPNEDRLVISRSSHDVSAVYSPDGKHIAFVANSDDNPEIYIANADGSGVVRLTRDRANDLAPSFSPDGTKLYFCSDREGKFAIYSIDLPH